MVSILNLEQLRYQKVTCFKFLQAGRQVRQLPVAFQWISAHILALMGKSNPKYIYSDNRCNQNVSTD